MASVGSSKGLDAKTAKLWTGSTFFHCFRRTSLVLIPIIIIALVWRFLSSSEMTHTMLSAGKSAEKGWLFLSSSEMTHRMQSAGKSAEKGGVGFVESEIRPKQSVLPNLPGKRHIVYIRIPKTGSSTTTIMVWRYAWTRNLSVLAVHPNYEGTKRRINPKQFFLRPTGIKFDVMAEHVMFDKGNYDRYFPNDTFYFTQLREPMNMLHSSLYYVGALSGRVKGYDKVKLYLQQPKRYDALEPSGRSYTKNPQSSYLGLPVQHFNSTLKIQEYIQTIEKDLSLVMILEKLDESLILFRRLTKWPMKDLIYKVRNINKKKPNLQISPIERQIYRNWSLADHMFYDYFSQKLERQVAEAGPTFQKELKLFKKYRFDVAHYCRFDTITDNVLSIPATPYHEAFAISRKDCSMIEVEPSILISALRKRQHLFPYLRLELVGA